MEDRAEIKTKTGKIIAWLSRYNVLINGKHVKCGLVGWRTALAHARKEAEPSLFDEYKPKKVVEIFNCWTSEIVTLEEAEKRAAIHARKRI